ncbi:MAG TPA: pyridoxamine 5'-phosphate oxidase family protein [Candidatus Cloacimonetes bacterium]|nr:pyridoxamine 5'-phosphate oxidase family protein [Candidatus Cloacimonadota bacterium]
MSENIKKEIFSYFKQMQTVFFATCDKERPYVRPMLLLYIDGKFWVATGADDAKTPQLKKNPHFEFCYFIEAGNEHGYIRGAGMVNFISDLEIRKKFIDDFGYIRHYWQEPDDPDYVLLECKIDHFEYMRPGAQTADSLEI